MSHLFESGMMGSGKPAWHNLGTVIDGVATSEDAIRLAGLDWTVATQEFQVAGKTVDGYRAVVRDSDQSTLGIVGERYHPIQNTTAFNFMDEVVGEKLAMYDTAGSLDGGRRVWMLAKLPGDIIIPGKKGENIEKYLLLANSHDGSGALKAFFTSQRVVCANTLALALKEYNGREGVSIRHTANAKLKIQEAQRILGLATEYYQGFEKKILTLANAKYTEKQMVNLAEYMFPAEDDKISTRTKNNRENLVGLFESGVNHKNIAGTAWAGLNAVTEFTTHHKGTRATGEKSEQESRLNSVWFGSGRVFAQKAYDFINTQISA